MLVTAHGRGGGAVFGIVQGGAYEHLRLKSLQALVDIGFDGYAVGGMSVGEPEDGMYKMMSAVIPKVRPPAVLQRGDAYDDDDDIKLLTITARLGTFDHRCKTRHF